MQVDSAITSNPKVYHIECALEMTKETREMTKAKNELLHQKQQNAPLPLHERASRALS
jgi:hypothetical protein